MRIGLISNWGMADGGCGVANFGLDWEHALHAAGHTVVRGTATDHPADCDQTIVNFDSGTLPHGNHYPVRSTFYVHHTYRGIPEGLETARLIICPMKGNWEYFPYPVPAYRSPIREIIPRTIGVTTIRKEGVDWLQWAAATRGFQVCPPDRWRSTEEEIDRLAQCAMVALWYADSPCRSLALATALAAQRPLLLTTGSRMFEYAEGDPDIYWAQYGHGADPNGAELERVMREVEQGTAKLPTAVAERWSWPVALAHLESLWRS